jgi:hypothetical protein
VIRGGDAELEVWAAHRQARALEMALDRKIFLEKVPYRKGLKSVETELTRHRPALRPRARDRRAVPRR